MGECGKLRRTQDIGMFSAQILCMEGGAKGSHQSGNGRPGYLLSGLLLKAAEDGIVQESPSLHYNMVAQLIRRGNTDHLVQCIFNNAHGQAGGNILYIRTVFLGLFHGGIHEYGAARSEIHRMLCKQAQF